MTAPVTNTARPPSLPGSATPATCPAASAARPTSWARTHVCAECFGPLEVAYDLPARSPGARSRPARTTSGATPACCRCPPTSPPGPTLSPAGPGWCGPTSWPARLGMRVAVGQGRARQPDPLVQGPGRGGRPGGRARARLQGPGLPLHRQPGQRGGRRGRAGPASARCVLIPADLEPEKIIGTAVYGGTVVAVQGSYDDVNRLASELADEREDWAFVNVNVRPYYAEGSKTIGFEIAEQLGWRLPEQIVVPVASGAQLVKIDKAFRELVDARPGRGHGCTGLRRPGRRAARRSRPRSRPGTTSSSRSARTRIAKSLAIGNPADGPYVLDVVRRTGGAVADVDRRRDGRRDPAARRDRGHLRRDRGRGDPGVAAQAASSPGSWTPTPRPSSSTPATA